MADLDDDAVSWPQLLRCSDNAQINMVRNC